MRPRATWRARTFSVNGSTNAAYATPMRGRAAPLSSTAGKNGQSGARNGSALKTFSARLEDRGEFKKRRNPEKTKHGFAGLRLKVTAEKGAAAKGAAESAAKIDNLTPLRPGHAGL